MSKGNGNALKRRKAEDHPRIGDKAENYVEAHASDIVFGIDPKSSNTRSLRPDTRQCHNCGEVGHIRTQCPEPLSPRSVRETLNTSTSPQTSPQQKRQFQQSGLNSERQCRVCQDFGHLPHQCPSSLSPRGIRRNGNVATSQQSRSPGRAQQLPRSGLRCFLCDRTGHLARNCLVRPKVAAMLRRLPEREKPLEAEETEVKVAACQPVAGKSSAKPMPSNSATEPDMRSWLCQRHGDAGCAQCMYESSPAHRCQAMIAICQDCGLHHPVAADACLLQDETYQMPVADGTVGGKPVSVLRYTGCSTVIVRRSLVPDDQLTGLEERCILIDGTIRRTPVAKIEVETPYFSKTVLAVCMENPLYELIIGNISGAADPQPSSRSPPSAKPKVPNSSAFMNTGVDYSLLLMLLPVLLLFQLLRWTSGWMEFWNLLPGKTPRQACCRPRHNKHNRQQPDLNLREPSPESATVRPKLKLLPRTIKDPVNTVVHTEDLRHRETS